MRAFGLSHYFLHPATMFCICSELLSAKEFGLQLLRKFDELVQGRR